MKLTEVRGIHRGGLAFRPPQTDASFEWEGEPLGLANLLTKSRAEGGAVDLKLDAEEKRHAELRGKVRRALEGPVRYVHDAILHGARVRVTTNSFHLADYAKLQWPGVPAWESATGLAAPREPSAFVYGVVELEGEPEGAHVAASERSVYVVNSSYYGQLRRWVLAAAARELAKAEDVSTLRAALVSRSGRGILIAGVGKTTAALGLVEMAGARLVSDDVAFVRLAPRLLACGGERQAYVRTGFVECFPRLAAALLRTRLENVPDRGETAAWIEAAVREVEPRMRNHTAEELRSAFARLTAFENSRALVDPAALVGADRAEADPTAAVPVDTVVVLGRDPAREVVVERLDADGAAAKLTASPADAVLGASAPGRIASAARAFAVNAVLDREPRFGQRRLAAEGLAKLLARLQDEPPAEPKWSLADAVARIG